MRPTGINNDNHFEFTPDLRMERSTFNRKFRTLTTFNAGQLIPVFLDQSITYGDTVSMDLSNITRLITPLNPTMDNARIDFYAYQVPIRQIWKHFKEFQGENTIGAWAETREFAKPQLKIKWLKYFNGAYPVNITIRANYNGPNDIAPVYTYTGAGAGLRQAVLNAIMTTDTQANDYAKTNLLTGYYQPFSLMDYFGIPDITANIKPHTLDWHKASRTRDRVAITGVGTRNEITAQIDISYQTLVDYGYTVSSVAPTTEILVKSINDILNAFGTNYTDTDGSHPIIEIEVSALPFRAYQYIYDNAFRNQNYIAPVPIETYNGDETMTNGEEFYRGGTPAKVNRASDYFSTCLPEPQKGNAILTPIGTSAPVKGNGKAIGLTNDLNNPEANFGLGSINITQSNSFGVLRAGTTGYNEPLGTTITTSSTNTPTSGYVLGLTMDPTKSGIVADLSQAVAATVNAQRLAFAVQHILERDARGGTLYQDQALSHFGVRIPSLIAQVPEYLGGESIPISITQINQTSATTTTPLGETGANSVTGFSKRVFTKSFLEPCILMVLAAVRTDRTYGQGIHRDWFKKYRLDDYYPELAHLGEQAVYNREIYATGTPTDTEVWGYQERWVELRTGWSNTTGAMRVTYAESLDVWHYGDKYESMPVLSKDWLQEDTARLDRTLVYSAETTQQLISDWLFECRYTRIMPIYSIPSLIDHY